MKVKHKRQLPRLKNKYKSDLSSVVSQFCRVFTKDHVAQCKAPYLHRIVHLLRTLAQNVSSLAPHNAAWP